MYLKVVIVGATGYVGIELVRLLSQHPNVSILALCAHREVGVSIGEVYCHHLDGSLPDLVNVDDVNFSGVDVVFLSLPHHVSHSLVKTLPEHLVIIDLSADFRLKDSDVYGTWYGQHSYPEALGSFVYGLADVYKDDIRRSRLIACPGCYATAVLLPLLPMLHADVIDATQIIVDAKSGVSGAGRATVVGSLFCEVSDGLKTYNVGKHRHMPEITQELNRVSSTPVSLHMTPHLVPMNRGILCTIYVDIKIKVDFQSILHDFYGGSHFVHVDQYRSTTTRSVANSNHCYVGVMDTAIEGKIILSSVIDNLLKGAAGQAVQCMNLVFDFDETTGLLATPCYP